MSALFCMSFCYLTLIIGLLQLVVKLKQREQNLFNFTGDSSGQSASNRENNRIFYAHFMLILMCLFLKLVATMTLFICFLGIMDTNHLVAITIFRLFNNASQVFLYIAFSLNLYRWTVCVIRVNFYGGSISQKIYTTRIRRSKTWYTFAASLVGAINCILIIVDAIKPKVQKTQASTIIVASIFIFLIFSMLFTGSMLIRRLWVYFKRNYNK